MAKDKPESKAIEGIELDDPCPFCGGKVAATLDEKGKPDGIVHSLPMCQKFKTLSAEQYILAREAALERHN